MLIIQDDGQGFDVRQMKGLGLLGIQERVARLGGICERSLKARRRNHPLRGIAVHRRKTGALETRETDSHPVS